MQQGKSRLDHWAVSLLVLFVLIVAVVAIWVWLPEKLAPHLTSPQDRGVFGDSYGAVTSLFTGLGFAGLVFTILLQQREIKLQRDDFTAQLKEMQSTRGEVSKQSQIHEMQLNQSIVQLKFNALQTKLELIKIDSLKFQEHTRGGYAGPQIEQILVEMNGLIQQLELRAGQS